MCQQRENTILQSFKQISVRHWFNLCASLWMFCLHFHLCCLPVYHLRLSSDTPTCPAGKLGFSTPPFLLAQPACLFLPPSLPPLLPTQFSGRLAGWGEGPGRPGPFYSLQLERSEVCQGCVWTGQAHRLFSCHSLYNITMICVPLMS